MRRELIMIAISLTVLVVGPVNGSPASASAPDDDRPRAEGVRALTADEVRARGLDEYVDMSRYRPAAPTISATAETAPSPSAVGTRAASADVHASGCWNHWFSTGSSLLYGRTDVTWCSDGVWITYASSNCWGTDSGWPTYEYLGCNRATNYGVGWSAYDVKTQWHLCPAWNPIWGSCITDEWPWQKWRYGAQGQKVELGWGG